MRGFSLKLVSKTPAKTGLGRWKIGWDGVGQGLGLVENHTRRRLTEDWSRRESLLIDKVWVTQNLMGHRSNSHSIQNINSSH